MKTCLGGMLYQYPPKSSPSAPIFRSAEFIPLQRSMSRCSSLSGATPVQELKRTKVRARALEREHAQEGGSPSVAELPARNGK